MTAEQLAAYFGKKIAKPIPFSVCVERERDYVFRGYELKVTAVEEEILHVTVFLKGTVMNMVVASVSKAADHAKHVG